MAVETSLSKLQNQVDKLEKENIRLRDTIEREKEKNHDLRKKISLMNNFTDGTCLYFN